MLREARSSRWLDSDMVIACEACDRMLSCGACMPVDANRSSSHGQQAARPVDHVRCNTCGFINVIDPRLPLPGCAVPVRLSHLANQCTVPECALGNHNAGAAELWLEMLRGSTTSKEDWGASLVSTSTGSPARHFSDAQFAMLHALHEAHATGRRHEAPLPRGSKRTAEATVSSNPESQDPATSHVSAKDARRSLHEWLILPAGSAAEAAFRKLDSEAKARQPQQPQAQQQQQQSLPSSRSLQRLARQPPSTSYAATHPPPSAQSEPPFPPPTPVPALVGGSSMALAGGPAGVSSAPIPPSATSRRGGDSTQTPSPVRRPHIKA